MQIIQTKHQNCSQGFTGTFPLICPIPAHAIQQEHKPPIRRLCSAGGHTVKRCTSTNTQIPPPHRTLYRAGQPPYYNKVYKGAWVRPVMDSCQTVQHITDHASPAAGDLAPDQRGGHGGRRGTIDGYRRISFSGFRPIANRGHQ